MEKDCCKRTKIRTPQEYKRLINRLNRLEGQIRGIKNMVENNAYCPDILIQTSAVQSARSAFSRELLSPAVSRSKNIRNRISARELLAKSCKVQR